jgi:hypothetical protein
METAVCVREGSGPGFKWPVRADAEGASFADGANEPEKELSAGALSGVLTLRRDRGPWHRLPAGNQRRSGSRLRSASSRYAPPISLRAGSVSVPIPAEPDSSASPRLDWHSQAELAAMVAGWRTATGTRRSSSAKA